MERMQKNVSKNISIYYTPKSGKLKNNNTPMTLKLNLEKMGETGVFLLSFLEIFLTISIGSDFNLVKRIYKNRFTSMDWIISESRRKVKEIRFCFHTIIWGDKIILSKYIKSYK